MMSKKIRFEFLFSDCDLQNVHLTKDLGMIPFFLKEKFNYETKIVCTRSKNEKYANLKDVPGLKIEFCKKPRIFYLTLYLFRNAKKIDVLMQEHTNPPHLFLCILYKFLNKNGISYVKGDFDKFILDMNKLGIYNIIRKIKNSLMVRFTDILSIEDQEIYNFMKKQYHKHKEKILYLPNGFEIPRTKTDFIKFKDKKKLMVTVGRLGTSQKATENLLDALSIIKSDLKNWKILLIGPVEDKFKEEISSFYEKNPELHDNVIFCGPIMDRNKLYGIYKKSKIFCMSSRFEGFAHVFPEAAFFGNTIVSTKVGGAEEITNFGKYGKISAPGDIKKFADNLRQLISNENLLKEYCEGIQKYCRTNFTWTTLLRRLDKKIKENIELKNHSKLS